MNLNRAINATPARQHLVQTFSQPMFSARPASRVLVVDDHAVMREGLKSLLRDQRSVSIVGEAADGNDAVDACIRLRPDVVLMDLELTTLDGIDAITSIRRRHPEIRIIVLAGLHSETRAAQALRAGANAYVLKRSSVARLIAAFHAVREDKAYLDPDVHLAEVDAMRRDAGNDASDTHTASSLTRRERQILKLIAEGKRNREIAETLYISQKTVETHRMNLMRKLDAHNVAEISTWARRLGVVAV